MFHRMQRAMRGWIEYRTTVDELSRLSNRQLIDIGVFRDDIPYVAQHGRDRRR